MKIKLRLNKITKEYIQDKLKEKNIEVSEESKLILTEEDYVGDTLVVVACNDELHFYEACGFEKSNDTSPMFITSLWT